MGILGALSMACAVAGAAADAPSEAPCANFGRVAPGLCRGAEPTGRCLDHPATLGIRTVVNLRDDGEESALEQANVLARGIRYMNHPLSGFNRPSLPDVQRALAVISGTGHQPVSLHCKRGSDPTGVVVAAYRMTRDGWPTDQALHGAKRFGSGWWQVRRQKEKP